jgi:hypothetical protein
LGLFLLPFTALLKPLRKPIKKQLKRFSDANHLRLGIAIAFPFLVFIILLIAGNSFAELGKLIFKSSIVGSIIHFTPGAKFFDFGAHALISVGLSVYIGEWLLNPFDEEPWYIRCVLALVQFLFTAALAIAFSVPFAALGNLGANAIDALSDCAHNASSWVNLLAYIPLFLLRILSWSLILLTLVQYLSSISSLALGLVVYLLLAVILMCFGVDIDAFSASTLSLLPMAISAELFSAFEVEMLELLRDIPHLGEIIDIALEAKEDYEFDKFLEAEDDNDDDL